MKVQAPYSKIAEILLKHKEGLTAEQISFKTGNSLDEINRILNEFIQEGLVKKEGSLYKAKAINQVQPQLQFYSIA